MNEEPLPCDLFNFHLSSGFAGSSLLHGILLWFPASRGCSLVAVCGSLRGGFSRGSTDEGTRVSAAAAPGLSSCGPRI